MLYIYIYMKKNKKNLIKKRYNVMTEDQGSCRERNKDKVCERDILRKYHKCTVMKVTVQS